MEQAALNFQQLDQVLPRYMRLVASTAICNASDLYDDIRRETSVMIQPITWLPTFCAIPGTTKLSQTIPNYKSMGLFPMDIASSLPILCLGLPGARRSTTVLDLCCCPGAKFQMISELLSGDSTLVGVDISESRLRVCKSLLESWQQHFHEKHLPPTARQLLFHADGTQFDQDHFGDLLYDSEVFYINDIQHQKSNRKRKNKSSKLREAKMLKVVSQAITGTVVSDSQQDEKILDPDNSNEVTFETEDAEDAATSWQRKDPVATFRGRHVPLAAFDFVLVDAECTHDASYRHMKFVERGYKWTQKDSQGEEEQQTELSLSHNIRDLKTSTAGREELQKTQRGLIENGFRLLKPGGSLVYSTCSQEQEQNEDVVQWLLDSFPEARLEDAITGLQSQCAAAVLKADQPSVLSHVLQEHPSEDADAVQKHAIAMLHAIAQAPAVQLYEGSLPGTIRVNMEVGMSGHFIAKISKSVL